MSRRSKIIIGVSIALFIIAVLLFYFFYLKKPPTVPDDNGTFPPSSSDETPPLDGPPVTLPDGALKEGPALRQLTTTPIAGAIAGIKDGVVRVRYIDRATGNALEIPATGGEVNRLTNTTIPKVYEALWDKAGSGVILRYLKDDDETIRTFSARIKSGANGTPGELQGTFLPQDILALALSPSTTELVYLREEGGRGVVTRALFDGSGKTELWRSPMREWLPAWNVLGTIALQSKPSVFAGGILLSLNRDTGVVTPLLSGVRGLTTLESHTLSSVLYSESTNSGFSLNLLTSATGEREPVSLTTLPEKCVWDKDDTTLYCGVPSSIIGGSYPDAWYQGVVSFADELWSISVQSGNTSRISPISLEAGTSLDLIQPALSPDEKFLIFTNKTDGTLWSYQLKK
ncbi:MAG: hypothetical protein Q7R93_03980 [bacterium]|nr:hypothetical protein [bacterium]